MIFLHTEIKQQPGHLKLKNKEVRHKKKLHMRKKTTPCFGAWSPFL